MSVCLLLIGDGRDDYRDRTIDSAKLSLPKLDDAVEIDDSDHKLGFAGAVAEGWRQVLERGHDWCFHLEADFVFNRPVPVADMRRVLEANPHLVQMALLRGPENPDERDAGGIIQQHPEDFKLVACDDGHQWVEHRRFFTTNPSLIPAWVMRSGWPQVAESEGHFGLNLFASDPHLRSAFWGDGTEWVAHIGRERVGVGY